MYHIAQVNIARMLAPLTDPVMAGFVARLDAINAIADSSPGFIWRLQTPEGDATAIRPYEDDQILVNLSVWASLQALSNFVYASEHRQVMKQRRQWFQRFDGPYMALWWVPQGHIPTVEEAKERLAHLRTHDETPYAFSFKKPFSAPGQTNASLTEILADCLT
jgi:heme-degrading monooxygenase HmoA